MKICELKLKNFGKFSDKRIALTDGIQILYGENESGNRLYIHLLRECCLEWNVAADVRRTAMCFPDMNRGRIRIIMPEALRLRQGKTFYNRKKF